MKILGWTGLLGLFFFLSPAGLAQGTSEGKAARPMHAVFLPSVTGVGTLEQLDAVLKGTLEKGWHIYWRSPGDTGLAPEMDWSGSGNVKNVEVGWLPPKRFEAFGMYSYGYEDEVFLPLTITPERQGAAVDLSLEMKILACNKICIPQTLSVSLVIPKGPALGSDHQKTVREVFAALPSKKDTKTLRLDTAVLGKDSLILTAWAQQGFEGADIIVEAPGISLSSPPEIIPDETESQRALFKINAPEGIENLTEKLFGKKVIVTLVNRGQAVEKEFSF
ncbi:MAG: hypothetical protein H6853_02600 [Rhodospirillales bacterium]|nr:hypothetical protein [Alphaproteobacteria bacterium]USO04180.1 MAG: hypothetical protein H6853_02600 [Rhodospirillales bacterium]